MNVVIVHVAYWEQLLGGAELQLSYLAQYHAKQGDEVHVVYVNRSNTPLPSSSTFKLYPINQKRLPGRLGKNWFVHSSEVMSMLRSINPDILITRTRSSFAGLCATYALKNGKRHQHFVASDSEIRHPLRLSSIYRVFDHVEWMVYSRIFRNGSDLICQNRYQSSYILKHYGIQARVLTQLAPEPDVDFLDKPQDRVELVWIANLKVLKRPELFIELARRLSHRKDIVFTMIGADHGGNYKSLIDTTKNMGNFRYLGKLTNDAVNRVLCSSHVLVNTSEYEGFSNTFVQAWLREAVVISLVSNPDEILTDQGIGYVTGNVANTAKVVEALADDRCLLREKASRSREYAIRNQTFGSIKT